MRNPKKLIVLVLILCLLAICLVLVLGKVIVRPAADGTVGERTQPLEQNAGDGAETGGPGEDTGGPGRETYEGESAGRIPVDENGLDADGRVVAYFGSPDSIDGEIEDAWSIAEPVRFTKMLMGRTNTTATMRVLWDDRAVYFLVEVKDENLSDASVNVYEKDSVEFFLDEDNRRSGIYEGDDSQFRINFKNERSADHGDLTNLYSAAKVVEGGYVVEGRVALLRPPANGKVMGVEAQVNDAVGSTRIATLNIFDSTGTAYMDTSKFGEMILTGKGPDSVSKPNFYDLLSLVESAKEIELVRYANGDVVGDLIRESEAAIADINATQETYDDLFNRLETAIEDLVHNDLSFDEKECRDIPR